MNPEPTLQSSPTQSLPSSDLLEWVRGKITEAETSLRAREQMEETFRTGTNSDWKKASDMHPSTAGNPMSKKARLEMAGRQGRIAVKCRRELAMFKATFDAISKIN